MMSMQRKNLKFWMWIVAATMLGNSVWGAVTWDSLEITQAGRTYVRSNPESQTDPVWTGAVGSSVSFEAVLESDSPGTSSSDGGVYSLQISLKDQSSDRIELSSANLSFTTSLEALD